MHCWFSVFVSGEPEHTNSGTNYNSFVVAIVNPIDIAYLVTVIVSFVYTKLCSSNIEADVIWHNCDTECNSKSSTD